MRTTRWWVAHWSGALLSLICMVSAVWWLIAMEYDAQLPAWTRVGRMVQRSRPERIAPVLIVLGAFALLYFGHELRSALRDRRRSRVPHVDAR
ncbi:hypothetical protein [Actinacidiphila glaucinigra]|uniref:Uncharacterized protein n=1 Tax=Actinacidiphila glaucinigra TaxID=235986 RepID=A0A239HXA5_9ACTN|nr:hypothetical protein [Actinacidiphila glaucinigra]SNS85967.1 hypothetical protein SAMN05216252_109152 [Actinacidiphila glaucinigra]